MERGKFITFEGGEGTGKSTHARLLATSLEAAGHTVLVTREPGGTPDAEAIRALLVSGDPDRWSPEAEALLNYAARDDHLTKQIRPALDAGTWVVCDRYIDSTRAYQGSAGGADSGLIDALERVVVAETMPDLTLVLDLDPAYGLDRAGTRAQTAAGQEDRFEGKGDAFHRQLRDAFLRIAEREPDRCLVIDGAGTKEAVAEIIWQAVVTRLSP
ncbi:MAG: dTMP kinase [Hyphomicrobiales bacterium]